MKHEKNRIEQIIIENEVNISSLYNIDIKLKFIEWKYPLYKEKDDHSNIIKAIQRFNEYGKIENSIGNGKDLFDFTQSDFIKFFQSFPWSYRSFLNHKSFIKRYLVWACDEKLHKSFNVCRDLESIGYNNPSYRKMYEKYYFSSLDELMQAIAIYRDNIKKSQFVNFHIAEISLYFAWLGVEMKDLCEMQIQDFNEHQIFIRNKNQYIRLNNDDKRIVEIITNYIESNCYPSSSRLIRTETQGIMSEKDLANLVSKCVGRHGKQDNNKNIQYKKIYWSGIYYRATKKIGYTEQDISKYNRKDEKDIEKLSAIFQIDFLRASNPQQRISTELIKFKNYLKYLHRTEYYRY